MANIETSPPLPHNLWLPANIKNAMKPKTTHPPSNRTLLSPTHIRSIKAMAKPKDAASRVVALALTFAFAAAAIPAAGQDTAGQDTAGQDTAGQDTAGEDVIQREGDWTVNGEELIRDQHVRLNGSLILPAGSKLTLESSTLEIVGDYSRQHSVEWRGGTLITKDCEIGGFVNANGTAIHTVFHLFEGLWEATDTTVSYSYGISFHWEKGKGILRGKRLKAGPRPDAIILSGEAEVDLVDCDFPIGLGVYCNKGGSTTLSLMPGNSQTAVYDRETLLPGVNWRLTLTNTRVERWFLFLRRIGEWQPPAVVTINKAKDMIVSLFTHNLKGDITLTNELKEPLQIGNLTLKRSDQEPAGISMYAMYFSGDETDATIRGKTHICEWMQGAGTVRVQGIKERKDLTFGCTTLELSNDAKLVADRVHFGRPLTWQPESNIGEANVKDEATLIAHDISANNVRFRTEGKGRVEIFGLEQFGSLEVKEEGGSIEIDSDPDHRNRSDNTATEKPKVWIYTDMSDPTLKGNNKERTINDPDDVSAMAGYLLMANEFETLGIVVASTHRKEHADTPDQSDWANRYFGKAYQADIARARDEFSDYPAEIRFLESSIKRTGDRFDSSNDYISLASYPTVRALVETARSLPDGETIHVLCWGSLTEPAIAAAHCVSTGSAEILKRLTFIAHWTNSPLHQGTPEHPENVANCREDAAACAYMKTLAADGKLKYHECGAIGQHGIVSGGPKGTEYFDQFRRSQLGEIFVNGKFVHNGVDHSDSATYWTLLGDWGVSLAEVPSDGTNSADIEYANELKYRDSSHRIHNELLRRSNLAAGGSTWSHAKPERP